MFTSSTISRLFEAFREVGFLEAITGGVFAVAFGATYLVAPNGFLAGEAKQRALVSLSPRIALGAIFRVMGGLNGFFQFVPEHPSSVEEACYGCAPFLEGSCRPVTSFPSSRGSNS